jgi:hypothetical protein
MNTLRIWTQTDSRDVIGWCVGLLKQAGFSRVDVDGEDVLVKVVCCDQHTAWSHVSMALYHWCGAKWQPSFKHCELEMAK